MSSFDHFEEDQRSWETLAQLPGDLRAEAVSIWAVHPDASIAGLLIENGTPLHPDLASRFEGTIPGAKKGLCAIVTPDFARFVVDRHGGSAALEALRQIGDAGTGSLLVVVLTPNGLRIGHCLIWIPSPEDPSAGGPDFGEFSFKTSMNDDLKLLRQAVEQAKVNAVKPGAYFQRIVLKEERPDQSIFERIKLYCVDLNRGNIIITESSSGMTYARRTLSIDSIG